MRHDAVCLFLIQLLSEKTWRVERERTYDTALGRRKPDIVAWKEVNCKIVDVQIVSPISLTLTTQRGITMVIMKTCCAWYEDVWVSGGGFPSNLLLLRGGASRSLERKTHCCRVIFPESS